MSLNGLKDKNKEKEAENHPFKKTTTTKTRTKYQIFNFFIFSQFHFVDFSILTNTQTEILIAIKSPFSTL